MKNSIIESKIKLLFPLNGEQILEDIRSFDINHLINNFQREFCELSAEEKFQSICSNQKKHNDITPNCQKYLEKEEFIQRCENRDGDYYVSGWDNEPPFELPIAGSYYFSRLVGPNTTITFDPNPLVTTPYVDWIKYDGPVFDENSESGRILACHSNKDVSRAVCEVRRDLWVQYDLFLFSNINKNPFFDPEDLIMHNSNRPTCDHFYN